jgi:dihydroxy-acid dehydratase
LEIVGVRDEKKGPDEIAEILRERRLAFVPPSPRYTKGALAVYTRFAVSAMKGAYIRVAPEGKSDE